MNNNTEDHLREENERLRQALERMDIYLDKIMALGLAGKMKTNSNSNYDDYDYEYYNN